MATRLPNLRTLEGIEQMKHRLLLAENKLKEEERKADARRKIILGGAVIAMTKNNPTLALTVLKALDEAARKHNTSNTTVALAWPYA